MYADCFVSCTADVHKKNLQTKDLCDVNCDNHSHWSWITSQLDRKALFIGGSKSKGVALPFLLAATCMEQAGEDHPEVLMCILGGGGGGEGSTTCSAHHMCSHSHLHNDP